MVRKWFTLPLPSPNGFLTSVPAKYQNVKHGLVYLQIEFELRTFQEFAFDERFFSYYNKVENKNK
jgi:hypothetical protein